MEQNEKVYCDLMFSDLSHHVFCFATGWSHFKFLNPSIEICVLEGRLALSSTDSHTHSYNS